ncbi:MAG: hypothetical protein HC763_25945 [Hydrococcus sp. CRU_1_1]|nr:hypothetical protein [Hydrococcus sp. CRU_1_1]
MATKKLNLPSGFSTPEKATTSTLHLTEEWEREAACSIAVDLTEYANDIESLDLIVNEVWKPEFGTHFRYLMNAGLRMCDRTTQNSVRTWFGLKELINSTISELTEIVRFDCIDEFMDAMKTIENYRYILKQALKQSDRSVQTAFRNWFDRATSASCLDCH